VSQGEPTQAQEYAHDYSSEYSSAQSLSAQIGQAVHELPIFDVHNHYIEPAWEVYSVSNIIELMDESVVAFDLRFF
jgi:hypothetical protein